MFNIKIVLLDLGLDPSKSGFNYLLDSIEYIREQGDPGINMSKTVYPKLADKYKVSPACVERNIRTVLDGAHRTSTALYRTWFGTEHRLKIKTFIGMFIIKFESLEEEINGSEISGD